MPPFAQLDPPPSQSLRLGRKAARALGLTVAAVVAGVCAVVLAFTVAPVQGAPEAAHWPSQQRELVVVDRTGDAGWQRATRWAVDMWNRGDVGVRLTWTAGAGPCGGGGAGIEVCAANRADLAQLGVPNLEGLVEPDLDRRGHFERATVLVCADCGLDRARQKVVATHELGHALGLDRAAGAGALMHPAGGTDHPHGPDFEAVRAKPAHVDTEKDCLAGDVVDIGSVCL
jgi:hypothetical protein